MSDRVRGQDLAGYATPRLAHARARAAARDAAARVGLADGATRPGDGRSAAALRFGEQRLLQLARVLITGASVLLLDDAAGLVGRGDHRARPRPRSRQRTAREGIADPAVRAAYLGAG
jgi:ABC-type branched-subunit amino acid transport system ATPase component